MFIINNLINLFTFLFITYIFQHYIKYFAFYISSILIMILIN